MTKKRLTIVILLIIVFLFFIHFFIPSNYRLIASSFLFLKDYDKQMKICKNISQKRCDKNVNCRTSISDIGGFGVEYPMCIPMELNFKDILKINTKCKEYGGTLGKQSGGLYCMFSNGTYKISDFTNELRKKHRN